ncbi:MAG TPA: hypothetical protein VMR20_06780 [Verrucomicrobiae bacterium]|nr:hypothetical protein [Verrucomicrobiae bacterium]
MAFFSIGLSPYHNFRPQEKREPLRRNRKRSASSESIRFHLELAALDDPRAAKFTEKDFWDSSLVEEIRRSGFVDRLYGK